MTRSLITLAEDEGPSSAHTQTAMSETDTRGESRRTDDEAVTLPIPTSGLLSSPTQVGCHSARLAGGKPTQESHFSLAPLLSRGGPGSARSPRGQTAIQTAPDGPVLLPGSPQCWPTPSHSIREFGHMPSRACSSGGNPSASGRHSSCSTGAVTVAGMLVGAAAVCKEVSSQALLANNAASECSGERQRAPDSRRLWDQEHQARLQQEPDVCVEAEADVAQHLHLEDAELSAQIEFDGQQLHPYSSGGNRYLADICMGDDDADALDQDRYPTEPGEGSSLMHNPASCVTGDGISVALEAGEAEEEEMVSSRDVDCVVRGRPAGPKGGEWEGPPWLYAEECAVSDAITQLQAVVSGLSEPYQRYIRERALELTRIIDENLQRQGLEPVAQGAMTGMATPSKKAATAAAALVLAVAASGTRWPYSSTPSGGDGSATRGGGSGGGGAAASWPHMRSARTADGSFHSTDLAGHVSAASVDSVPFRGAMGGGGGPMIGMQAQALSYGGPATSGSCTLCFGSVLGNSQARPTESADQISGAVSARAASASQQAPSSNRPTPRSRSYSSYYAQQQSQRRLASLRANGGLEQMSAVSSACSNPYLGTAQPQDTSGRAVTSRRVPPRPPPRGLGCGLGQPRKLVSEGSRPTPDVNIHNLPYMMLPRSENPTPMGTARDHYRGGVSAREHYISTSSAREHYSNISTGSAREHYNSTASAREYYNSVSSYRRTRMSTHQLDQQQQHDQEELILGDISQLPLTQEKPHGVVAPRRGVGRPISGNGAILRPSGSAGNGHAAKNTPSGHINIRPATVAPPNYQPPWQRPPPARMSASGGDRQRPAETAAELHQKNRKATTKAVLTKAAPSTLAHPAAQPPRGVSVRKLPPAQQQQQQPPRPDADFEDDISIKNAGEPSTSDAGSCYQQLLRRSGGARSSLVPLVRRGGGIPTGTLPPATAAPPQSVPTPQHSRLSSFPIATSADLTSVCATAMDNPAEALASEAKAQAVPAGPATADVETSSALRSRGADKDDDIADTVAAAFHSNNPWDNVLQSDLPVRAGRHGFQPIASDEEDELDIHGRGVGGGPIEPLHPDWQPLHTALTLDELQALAQQPGGRNVGGAVPGNLRAAQAHLRHLSRGTSQGGTSDHALLSALTSGSVCGLPFNPETDEEPATAFAIIHRCGTRDRSSDQAASSTAATSSFGDLSRLLPAPAWRQVPSASDLPRPGRAAANSFAVASSVTSTTTTTNAAVACQGPPPAEVVESTASGHSMNVWDLSTAPDQSSRVRDSSFGTGVSGIRDSVIARDLTFGGAVEAPERGGGSAAAQLRNVLASLGGMHLIRGGSPVRPRYAAAGNSDSHASPQRAPRQQHQVQHRRRGEAAAHRDANSGRGGKAPRGSAATVSAAGNPRQKAAAASKRPSSGAVGTTGRAVAGGGKSRSTSRARGAKTHRAARAMPAAGRPPTGPQPPAPPVLLHQQQQHQQHAQLRPVTPIPPSSPPPPQQSQTPVQLQMQLQLQQQQAAAAGSGVRRWTESDAEDDDDNDNDHEEEEEEDNDDDDDDDDDPDDLEDPSQETSASEAESAGNQSTPPRLQLHIRSPEDMPLSVVARQSTQPPRMGVMLDAAATRSTFLDGAPMMAMVATTVAAQPSVPPTAGELPNTAPGAWGPPYGSSGASQGHRLRPGPSALGQRVRGVAYAPLPSHRWASGRTYTTTSIHTDGTTTTTTTVVASPGVNRGACPQDCTPNILSPPRNYDRPWATPTRHKNGVEMWAANDVDSGSGYVLPTCSDSPRPPGAMGQDFGDRDGSSVLGSPTTTGGRPGRITARPALVHSSPQRGQPQWGVDGGYDGGWHQPGLAEGGVTGAAAVAIGCWGPPAGTSGLTSGIGTIHEEGPNGLTLAAPIPGHSMPVVIAGAHRGPLSNTHMGLMFHRQPHFVERTSHLKAAASMAAVNNNAAAMAPAAFPHGPGLGGGEVMPDAAAASAAGADRSRVSSYGPGSSLGSQAATLPDTKAEGVQTDALDTLNDSTFNTSNRSGRRSSEGSRRPSSPTALTTSRTDGGRGYNVSAGRGGGRPPMAAFRPSVSLRAAPAGTGGAQLALVHQAAWPGLRDPRVVDALATLEAGIAVLDPAPPPPPSSMGTVDLSEVSSGGGSGGGSSLPNGCFGLFNRSTPAAPKAPVMPVQEPVGQRPVLLRVHVADGAVELVLLRPRRGGGAGTSNSGATPGGGGHGGVVGTHQPGSGEQRVRVAALSGLQPPLSVVLSPGGAANASLIDDMADPSSRWVQLVAMDGGLMRLSACTPADHARLVLGLNAGLMAAMGAIGEETPLSVVPLCRGLGGVP
ncbi:hypothetical protein VaNZ11_011135 [Volvox africanus]|uniref:Uncharacterized protein n=1 Tax=Volvox africanus TaxID=51714 RepID=A0ABQ5SC39_9CHLO|nr:hypothetical protein VaNZ11_011135 [Volvox africanus]